MAGKNKYPVVVKKPTGKVGGISKAEPVVKKPGGRVGGTNASVKVSPTKKKK